MRKIFLIASCCLLTTVIVFPFIASAAANTGLVPCEGLGCTFCDLFVLLQNVINFLLVKIMFPLAAILIVWGGIRIMFARGNPGEASKGKEMITMAVTGILIALLGWLIIDTTLKVLTGASLGGGPAQVPKSGTTKFGPWNQIECTKPAAATPSSITVATSQTSPITQNSNSGASPPASNANQAATPVSSKIPGYAPAGSEYVPEYTSPSSQPNPIPVSTDPITRLDSDGYQDGIDVSTPEYMAYAVNEEHLELKSIPPQEFYSPTELINPVIEPIVAEIEKSILKPELIKTVIRVETESGKMPQVEPGTAKKYDENLKSLTDVAIEEKLNSDPVYRAQIEMAYLGDLYAQYNGDPDKTISAFNGEPNADTGPISPTTQAIVAEVRKSTLDPNLIKAVIQMESGGKTKTTNDNDGKLSFGTMQMRAGTAILYDKDLAEKYGKDLKSADPEVVKKAEAAIGEKLNSDPVYATKLGTAYLQDLFTKYNGDLEKVIAGYNGGPGANQASRDCPGLMQWQCQWDDTAHTKQNTGYKVTRSYVPKVMNAYQKLSQPSR